MLGLALAAALVTRPAPAAAPLTVGQLVGGGPVVATGQVVRPAGTALTYEGRPVDLALAPNGKTVYVMSDWSVFPVNVATWKAGEPAWFGDNGGSQHGIAVAPDGGRLLVSVTDRTVLDVPVRPDGGLGAGTPIAIPGAKPDDASYPTGLAIAADGAKAFVCLSLGNAVAVLDLATRSVTGRIAVGVAPYAIVLAPDGKTAWVSNWGGRPAKPGDRTMNSAGTPVVVDGRDIAATGTVSLVDLVAGKEVAEVAVGLHPAGLALSADGSRLYVACENADAVAVVDTAARAAAATIPVRPDPALPFGSAPNALALAPDGRTLYVANGGNNAIAVVALGATPTVEGFIPTGFYPGAVLTDGRRLFVANVKGLGPRSPDARKEAIKKKEKPVEAGGWSDGWEFGLVSRVPVPTGPALAAMTAQVRADGRVPEALRALERSRDGRPAVPVPERAGEPSVFEHVVYLIKENRTYDQVFGDLGQGNGMKALCTFGREITPNQHALAEQFVLLDNYYCNGVISSDGHAWADEANCSAYLEKQFGGWVRTYDYGKDPLTFGSAGPIWEAVLAKGLSFRNYGETDDDGLAPEGTTFLQAYRDWAAHAGQVTLVQHAPMAHLKTFTCPDYPGWNLRIPDQWRADVFLKEFAEAQKTGTWPNFIILYLPQNHTSGRESGMPTPRAHVADNDLALGRIVEAVTRSRFWPTTAIFVEEDDPQDGYDHVDGHRSPCLVISPYSRLHKTVNAFYNQTSVLHTMERILGLGPLTQFDAMAPVMSACFGADADPTPFTAIAAKVPLDELNPDAKSLGPDDRRWAELSRTMDLRGPDRVNEDLLNRMLWAAMRPGERYPAEWAGAHGRGLAALGLALDGAVRPADPDGDGD